MVTAARPRDLQEEFEAAPLPLWREALVGLEWLALRVSPVFRGIGIEPGDGSAVVVVPGFLGSDGYLGHLHGWLERLGYRAYLSGIGRNVECPNVLTDRLQATVERAHEETGGKVHLIGHSLGGVLARSAATLRPELIASVITMASPFRGVRAHPLILRAAAAVRGRIHGRSEGPTVLPGCYSGVCTCESLSALRADFPRSVRQTAIYTMSDGVVDWRYCISDDDAHDVRVAGSHVGLVFNPQVYRHIAGRLAAARPRRRKART